MFRQSELLKDSKLKFPVIVLFLTLTQSNDCSSNFGVPLYGAYRNTERCEAGETCSILIEADNQPSGRARCVGQGGNVTSEVDYFTGLDKKLCKQSKSDGGKKRIDF